jgi:uncharacterized membrane protein (Fun14 family)
VFNGIWETHLSHACHSNPTVNALSEIITPVVYQLGLGAIGGFVAGFALKKIAKIFIIVLGIFIVALLYLGASNIININFGALWDAVGGWLGGAGAAASWLVGLIAIIPFIGSFGVGFFLGFKLG